MITNYIARSVRDRRCLFCEQIHIGKCDKDYRFKVAINVRGKMCFVIPKPDVKEKPGFHFDDLFTQAFICGSKNNRFLSQDYSYIENKSPFVRKENRNIKVFYLNSWVDLSIGRSVGVKLLKEIRKIMKI